MATQEKTLTFPFGETPEDVIRDQYDQNVNQYDELHVDGYGVFHGVTGLLTVLDALKFRRRPNPKHSSLSVELPRQPITIPDPDAKALRVAILASLGIEEV